MKKFSRTLCLLLIAVLLCACGGKTSPPKEVLDRGVLRVGVKTDVPGFGFLNPATNTIEGLEIDLAKLIAGEMLGDGEAVKLVGVTAQTREPMLENEELDVVIATFTITPERQKKFYFSEPYFHDEIGFLVKKDSDITTIADMKGKTVGVVFSGTAKNAFLAEAAARGFEPVYKEFGSYPEVKAALLSGEVDAFCVDKSILLGYSDESTVVLEEGFNPQDYGIAAGKDKTALTKYLDDLLKTIREDGRLDEIINRWSSAASD